MLGQIGSIYKKCKKIRHSTCLDPREPGTTRKRDSGYGRNAALARLSTDSLCWTRPQGNKARGSFLRHGGYSITARFVHRLRAQSPR